MGPILSPKTRFLLNGTRYKIAPRAMSTTQTASSEIVSSPHESLMGRSTHISLDEHGGTCKNEKSGDERGRTFVGVSAQSSTKAAAHLCPSPCLPILCRARRSRQGAGDKRTVLIMRIKIDREKRYMRTSLENLSPRRVSRGTDPGTFTARTLAMREGMNGKDARSVLTVSARGWPPLDPRNGDRRGWQMNGSGEWNTLASRLNPVPRQSS